MEEEFLPCPSISQKPETKNSVLNWVSIQKLKIQFFKGEAILITIEVKLASENT